MRPTTRRWMYLVIGVVLLGGAGRWTASLQGMRQSYELLAAPIDVSAAPQRALPLLFAAGRAIFIDYLWLRASKLKDEGRYFDAKQLAEQICDWEPRFVSVWAFNAWNMAYNISVTQKTGEERWRWVKNGIELLRDRGIPANPRSTQLYRELAWIYFHKVSDWIDEQHWYYKNEFALQMEDILGQTPDPDWDGFAAAPKDWKDLASDPEVARLAAEFGRYKLDISQPGFLLGVMNQQAEAKRAEEMPDEPPPAWRLLDDESLRGALKQAENYWRARRLREEVKIDSKRVVKMRKEWGPMDFRLSESHGLYWVDLGMEMCPPRKVRLDVERLNLTRVGLYCLERFIRQGRLVMSPEARKGVRPLLLPDTRFIPILKEKFLELSKEYLKDEPESSLITDNFDSAFKNYCRDWIVRYYEAGEMDKAQELFDWLRTNFPHEHFERGLEPFVMFMLADQLKVQTTYAAISRVTNYIGMSLQLFAYGKDREALTYLKMGRMVCDAYNKDTAKRTRLNFEEMVDNLMLSVKDQLRPESYRRLLSLFNREGPPAAP